MPERPSNRGILYEVENEALQLNDSGKEYILTTYSEGISVFNYRLWTAYGNIDGVRKLTAVRYVYHPNGMGDDFIDNGLGETFVARIDYRNWQKGYMVMASGKHWENGVDKLMRNHFLSNDTDFPKTDVSIFYHDEVDRSDGGLQTIAIDLLPLVAQDGIPYHEYKLINSEGGPLLLWRGRYGKGEYYKIASSTEDFLQRAKNLGVSGKLPVQGVFRVVEKINIIACQRDVTSNVLDFAVRRTARKKTTQMHIGLLMSLDAITTPPDLTNPQAIFQKMQEIRELLLELKPVIT